MSIKNYLHSNIPDQLLETMAWLGSIINKYKSQNPGAESIKPYEQHYMILHRVFTYIHDLKAIYRHNLLLKSENDWLKEQYNYYRDRLQEYETVTNLIAEDRLEEVDNVCRKIVEREQAIYDHLKAAEERDKQIDEVQDYMLKEKQKKLWDRVQVLKNVKLPNK